MGMIASPSFADLFAQYAQFDAGSVGLFKVPVQRRPGDGYPVHFFQEPVNDIGASKRLFLFQLHGCVYGLSSEIAGFSTIASALACQGVKAGVPVAI